MNILEYYQQKGKKIKLNLGCRNRPLPTYINIDIDASNPYADLIDNAFELNNIQDNSCDLIEAIHMAEHLSYAEFVKALRIWYRKLRNYGTLRLSVPDLNKICGLFHFTNNHDLVKSAFSGSQHDEWDFHKATFTKDSLIKYLSDAGFNGIKEWEYSNTWPHSYIDSYAAAVWPPMMKKYTLMSGEVDLGGIQLSLNLECVKR